MRHASNAGERPSAGRPSHVRMAHGGEQECSRTLLGERAAGCFSSSPLGIQLLSLLLCLLLLAGTPLLAVRTRLTTRCWADTVGASVGIHNAPQVCPSTTTARGGGGLRERWSRSSFSGLLGTPAKLCTGCGDLAAQDARNKGLSCLPSAAPDASVFRLSRRPSLQPLTCTSGWCDDGGDSSSYRTVAMTAEVGAAAAAPRRCCWPRAYLLPWLRRAGSCRNSTGRGWQRCCAPRRRP